MAGAQWTAWSNRGISGSRPQVRLRLGCRPQVGNGIVELVLKVEQYPKVGLRVHVTGVQPDYLGKHRDCTLRLLLLQMFLHLPFQARTIPDR